MKASRLGSKNFATGFDLDSPWAIFYDAGLKLAAC
jgi:hypothetical protein